MRKKVTAIFIALFLLVVAGCSAKNTTEKKSSNDKTKVESMYYDSLSSKDKKSMKFKFTEAQDETQDNTADPVFVVSMKVTNNTKKNIKFDRSKFLVFVSEQTKFKSAKTGVFTVKTGKSTTIHQLFENVAEQALVGGGSQFIYLNNDNKLADANFTIKDKTASKSDDSESSAQSDTSASQPDGRPSYKDADGNHTATGSYYDDNNPTAGWDESNLDPAHDGKRLDRIIAWTEHYKQVGLDQGMSDEDAQSYAMDIAQQKENAYEQNN
ncbi:hypothetical protein [Companilactobacillus ginsenosidimutans]|uniref:DUF5067 domain-containing protein n=1 Tax=Companilactobacillus ginsenosidimutans TaxID=1007676 RepID=A0A0H4R0H6_9LACO|nr:hypothetical protein [Companilactobacillus ginsenosidimutans]AKP67225.1 hypothetical protein ABM34_06530 [Companilactobacillus ginsenosidimutans]